MHNNTTASPVIPEPIDTTVPQGQVPVNSVDGERKRRVYVAGHMLHKGAQLLREKEKEIVKILGHEIYNPMDNKEINDKAALAGHDKLAERIVKLDTDALFWADTVLIEPLPEANGTLVELGQLKGMKDVAKQLLEYIGSAQQEGVNAEVMVRTIMAYAGIIESKKVIAHFEDIRRVDGITETGDRRSLGINQYVYGTVLDLTHGEGFTEWDDIPKALK